MTRARADIPELVRELYAAGAEVLELPAIAMAPVDDMTELDAALREASYDWFVFSSRNAVRVVLDRLHDLGLPLSPGVQLACVGASTAREAGSRGAVVGCVPDEGTGAALVRALEARGMEGKRVLLPTGNLARSEVREGLRRAGAIVREVVVYRTVEPPDVNSAVLRELRRGTVDVVTLGSPSALANLMNMLGGDTGRMESACFACIGPTTGAAARDMGLERVVMAEERSPGGLVRAIAEWYSKEKRDE